MTSVLPFGVQELWPKLRSEEHVAGAIRFLNQHIREGEKYQAKSRAALIHLEAQVIDVACDDPGRAVGSTVLLPMLRHRIETKAYEYYNRDILQAEQQVFHSVLSFLCLALVSL